MIARQGLDKFYRIEKGLHIPGAKELARIIFTFDGCPKAEQKRHYGVSGNTYLALIEFFLHLRWQSLLVFDQSIEPHATFFAYSY